MLPYTPEQQAIRQWLSKPYPMGSACCCIGPRDDDPVCPCAMSFVETVDGTYYKVTEHRSPDGVTHSAKMLPKVEKRLPYEEQVTKDLTDKAKATRDTKGITFAVKEYRAEMYMWFNTRVTLKDALDYVRAIP